MAKPISIHIEEIKLLDKLRVRAELNYEAIAEFHQAMAAGATFPPIDVFKIDGCYFLADGWHRYHAASMGSTHILATVHKGDAAEALSFALKANQNHGVRRTNADKRRAVQVALEQWPDLSSRALGELCGVSHEFVQAMRHVSTVDTSATRRGADGKQYPAKHAAPAAPAKLASPGWGEQTDKAKDEAESADTDRESDVDREMAEWHEWEGAFRDVADCASWMEGHVVPSSKRVKFAAVCRFVGSRFEKLASRYQDQD
jgi:hypothetical protein